MLSTVLNHKLEKLTNTTSVEFFVIYKGSAAVVSFPNKAAYSILACAHTCTETRAFFVYHSLYVMLHVLHRANANPLQAF